MPLPRPDPQLVAKLKWLLLARLSVAVLGICAILLAQAEVWRFPTGFEEAYSVLVTACFLNLVYLIAIRWVSDSARFMLFQIAVDVVLEALLAYYTGGVDSVFTPLFFASVLAAALLVSARASLFFASLATVLLSAITLVYFHSGFFGVPLPFLSRARYGIEVNRDLQRILPYLVFIGLSLHMVALLAGRLSAELTRIRIVNREILQNMADGVIAVDNRGFLVFLNEQACEMLGLPRERGAGRPVAEILPAAELQPLRHSLEEHQPRDFELKLHLEGRGDVAVEVRTSSLPGERGQVRGMIAMLTDISMRRILDEAMKRSERLQALSELSAGVAHEIRNPLASISGAVQELATVQSLSADDRKLMLIVQKESLRLDRIITDFLEFARHRSSGFQEVNLAEMLREVAILIEKREDSKRVTVDVEVPALLLVRADASQLKQVFYNLALNAVEASPSEGRVRLRGTVASLTGSHGTPPPADPRRGVGTGMGVRIDIIDQGQGVEPALLDRIFDPFFTTKARGTGMGLAIAHRIVQAHRGHISVESSPRQGAVFSVWLPA